MSKLQLLAEEPEQDTPLHDEGEERPALRPRLRRAPLPVEKEEHLAKLKEEKERKMQIKLEQERKREKLFPNTCRNTSDVKQSFSEE